MRLNINSLFKIISAVKEYLFSYQKFGKKFQLINTLSDLESFINERSAYVTQTTLSIDDTQEIINLITKKFPDIQSPAKKDICYATQNRQDAVKSILNICDYLIVIGSENSSNSRRLVELALKNKIESKLIDNKNDLDLSILEKKKVIGITAGASAPEVLLNEVIDFLTNNGAKLREVTDSQIQENVTFMLPKELRTL